MTKTFFQNSKSQTGHFELLLVVNAYIKVVDAYTKLVIGILKLFDIFWHFPLISPINKIAHFKIHYIICFNSCLNIFYKNNCFLKLEAK